MSFSKPTRSVFEYSNKHVREVREKLKHQTTPKQHVWVNDSTPGCDRVVKHTLFEDYKEHRRNPSVYSKPAWLPVTTEVPLGSKRCCRDSSDSSDDDYNFDDRKADPQLREVEWYEVDYIGVKPFKEFTKEERDGALLQPDDNQFLAEIDVMVKYIWLQQRNYFDIGLAEDIVQAGCNKYVDREIDQLLQGLVTRAQLSLQRRGYNEVSQQLSKTFYKYRDDGRVSRAVMYNRFVDGVGAFVKFEEEPFTDEFTKKWSIVARKFLHICSRTYTKYHKRCFDRRQAIRDNLNKMLVPDY